MENDASGATASSWSDSVVEELHATREQHARAFDYDIGAMVEDLKHRQEESGRKTVSFPPRRIGVEGQHTP